MRVAKLEQELAARLRELGFTVDEEGKAATLSGEVQIGIMRPDGDAEVKVFVDLPDCSQLICRLLLTIPHDDGLTAE